MAHLLLDSCKLGDVATKWTSISTAAYVASAGRWGDVGIVQITGSGGFLSQSFAVQNGAGIGCAMNGGGVAIGALSLFGDTGATNHLTATPNADRSVTLRRGGTAGTAIVSSAAGVIPSLSGWYYMELICYSVNDTTGHALVRVNGSTVIDYTGDTKNGGTNTTLDVARVVTTAAGTLSIEDVVVLDTTGAAPLNDFAGDIRVCACLPSGNGNYSQLLGSDGDSTNNYLLVDEVPPSIADFVGSGTSGQKDTYALANLPTSTLTVLSVQAVAYAAKNDAGAISGKTLVRSGSTDSAGTSVALGTTPTTLRTILATDPGTAAAWDVAGVNALEAGFQVA